MEDNKVNIQPEEDEKPKSNLSFQWSFRPLNIFMQIFIGVRFGGATGTYKWILWTHRCFILCINIFNQVHLLQNFLYPNSNNTHHSTVLGGSNDTTHKLPQNSLLTKFSTIGGFVYFQLIHLVFVVVSFGSSWRAIWSGFKQIQKHLNLTSTFYKKCRWTVYFGIFIIILDVLSKAWPNIIDGILSNTKSPMDRLYIAMDHISDLACALIVVLFFMLIRMATLLLIFLNEKFIELMDDSSIPATTHISELKKWKRQHFLVIQLAEKLSSSFGMILFLQFTWFCIRLFILTYRTFLWPREIIFDLYKLHSYRHWLEVFNEGHQFFITVYAAFDLQKEAIQVKDSVILRMIASSSEKNETKEHATVGKELKSAFFQVVHKIPVLSAAGCFKIDPSILPAIVATILTCIFVVHGKDYKINN